MRKVYRVLTLLFLMCSISLITYAQRVEENLVKWQYIMERDSIWRECEVPSVVQENLYQDGLLPKPYYRDNEEKIQWVSDHDWYYKTSFNIKKADLINGLIRLRFDGIDTYSSIYLNGEKLGETDNMFVPVTFDVTNSLKVGENILVVHLYSPLKKAHPQYLSNGFNYPADNDHAPIHYSIFTRKAPYQYGWDWGMRMVTMGIWKGVTLEKLKGAFIDNYEVVPSVDFAEPGVAKSGKIDVALDIQMIDLSEGDVVFTLYSPEDEKLMEKRAFVSSNRSVLRDNFEVQNPKLWWPNGWGDANLYRLNVAVYSKDGQLLDHKDRSLGFRSVKLVNEPDNFGTSFYFEINQIPIFAKGSNYIPGDLILTKRDKAYFESLFDDIIFANHNMIRIWGGGIYEDDLFYEEADRRGILVWQDFMFGCTAYPSDPSFLLNVKNEAEYQVKRLRKHPSIVLWCGNNEVEEAIKYWGWQKRFSTDIYNQLVDGYAPLFKELLPSVVTSCAPELDYIHSSPLVANWGRPKSLLHGDTHYWGLWYGEQPFDIFDKYPMRFVSEFGFQCFPPMKTIKEFAVEEDFGLETKVMRVHQKASTGNGLIKRYMEREYLVPNDFSDFVYVNQVVQARGMEYSIRSLRRQRPRNMGALYWQLNDAWPAVSWSSMDYFHNYKAMHYRMRHAFDDVALAVKQLPDNESVTGLEFFVINDALEERRSLDLRVTNFTFGGKPLVSQLFKIDKLEANSVVSVGKSSFADLDANAFPSESYIYLELKDRESGRVIASLVHYLKPDKELDLSHAKLEIKTTVMDGVAEIELYSETLVKDLYLELPWHKVRFTDNFFDLRPGERRTIKVYSDQIKTGETLPLEVLSMNDIHLKYGKRDK